MALPRKIEISHRTIIFTIMFLILLLFLYNIRDLIFEIFLALLIMAILNPIVKKLSKYKIPQGVSVFIAYLLGLSVVGVSISAIIPPLIEQTTSFVNNLPDFLDSSWIPYYFGEQAIQTMISQLGLIPAQIAKYTVSLLSNVLGVITVLIFAFYFLLARDKLDDQLVFLFGNKKKKEIGNTIDTLEKKLGGWARGQLILMFSVGLLTYIGLALLGVPYAFPLAILAGLLEIVPYIGPILAAIPAVIIGFGISSVIGLATAALAFLIQQLENYVLVPKIMEKSVGVNPVITLLALSIGFRMAGVAGAIVSIPIVITFQVFTSDFLRTK